MAHPHLFEPYDRNGLSLPHRIAMAPLTRNRAKGTIPGELNATYYAQRANAAILITEGTTPAEIGHGYADIPGLHNDAQQAGWKLVADAVHAAGDAKLVVQLMHCGRVAHPLFNGDQQPVAPSAVRHEDEVQTGDGTEPYIEPRPFTTDELPGVIEDFVQASRRAIEAGADGVELHAANGYLLHQFLGTNTNTRDDGWGDDVAGRIRFPLAVLDAVSEAIGGERVGIRISPGHPFNGMEETGVKETYDAFLSELDKRPLMYLHVLDTTPYAGYSTLDQAREKFSGTLMANEGFSEEFDVEGADKLVADGKIDLVAYGRRYIANPDLPRRLQEGAELNEPNQDTFYGGGAEGYTDYPSLDEVAA